jgi:single-stranded DNA-specific DHH superfamily exonuclease
LDSFFEPSIENLFDPFLFVGMDRAVAKILEMRDKKGRVVVF